MHIAWNASEYCVQITGELPTTITIDDKRKSGIFYIANTNDNLFGFDFIESLGFLGITFNFVCKGESRFLFKSINTNQAFSLIFTNNLGPCI